MFGLKSALAVAISTAAIVFAGWAQHGAPARPGVYIDPAPAHAAQLHVRAHGHRLV